MIMDILDAGAANDVKKVQKILSDFRIVDIDVHSADNYVPDARAVENMSDPYDELDMKNDIISKEFGTIEKAVDDLIRNKETSQKKKISKWGTRSTENTKAPEKEE